MVSKAKVFACMYFWLSMICINICRGRDAVQMGLNLQNISIHFQLVQYGINYFADLRMTFRQNFFLQDWFRNKFGVGLG
jgi:hypothetical protein